MIKTLKPFSLKMQNFSRIIIPRSSNSIFKLSLLHTSTLSPPHPTTSHYDNLVNEAGKSQDLRRVHHLLIKRIDDGCFNSKDTFNFITNTQSSLSTLDDVFECIADLPKGLPRRSAFESFVGRLCKLGLLKYALQVLDKMRERKYEVNAYSFHPVLNALTRKKETENALRVLEGMREVGIKPDTTAYNYVLTAHCAKGEVISAADLVGRMVRKEGLKGDTRTYDALVLGACRAGKVEGAVAVVRAAVEDGVGLMYCTYAHVIKGLLDEGFYEQGAKFVKMFAGREKGLDKENFEVLGNGLLKLERFEDVKMVVDEMVERGLPMGQKLRDFHQLHSC